MPAKVTDLRSYIMDRIKINPVSGCWEWQRYKDKKGYGRWIKGLAHRLAYTVLVGPIPCGLTLDHICRNRACVRPLWHGDPNGHVEPVTMRENILRGEGVAAKNHRKPKCCNGHPLYGPNLKIIQRDGRTTRVCIECDRDRKIRHNWKSKGMPTYRLKKRQVEALYPVKIEEA